MKKIIDVEITDSKIIFKIRKKFLFYKKEYVKSIDIDKISKIEKIIESDNCFTDIIFYRDIMDEDNINLDAIDEEMAKSEILWEYIDDVTFLDEVPACGYGGIYQNYLIR